MKRLYYSLFFLTIAVNSQATGYYDSGSFQGSGLPGWISFIGLLLIIWGVLQIILFFKVWGMTNDIKALKEDHFSTHEHTSMNELLHYLRKNYVLGNKDKVKEALLMDFIDQMNSRCNVYRTPFMLSDDPRLDMTVVPYVENLIKQFAKIGEEVPDYILKMKTYRDYFEFYKQDDFMVIDKES